ncbi:Protein kinase domain containing protein [Planoprotostelium fungivorum]|uniref:Protein kinase domain containing protein n=1 Tax=Planoprotostelium fungivorum TaxID=1890364 RepID=A0A2P6NW74_9EUKA|nr:Protein kinase domain containing protein [Planoprotostelium fungivorum]
MFKGVARGLEHSHRQGIAHLDIKPENIMVGKDGHLTLIDFGLAAKTLGLCHQFSGSADYASPEVWRNMPFEPSCSDVWSLGIILHILLTGCLPFDPAQVQRTRVSPDVYWPKDIDVSADAREKTQADGSTDHEGSLEPQVAEENTFHLQLEAVECQWS